MVKTVFIFLCKFTLKYLCLDKPLDPFFLFETGNHLRFIPVGLRTTFSLKNSSNVTDLFEDSYSVTAADRIQKKNKNFEL